MANQIVNVEVLADLITEKLGNNVKFMPLAKVVPINQQGGTVGVTKQKYIGDAQVVAPGQLIPASDFNQERVNLEIGKLAKRVPMTEEELLSAFGDPAGTIERQMLKSLENGLDKAIVSELTAITGAMVHDATTAGAINKEVLADALTKFGEDQEDAYLLVNPATKSAMMKDPDFIIKSAQDGLAVVGEIYGVQVVLSASVPAGEAYLVKPEAVHLYIRKQANVEQDKDIATQTHEFVGTVYFGAILAQEDGAVKIDLAV